jgi:hypothetical protein
LQQEEKTKKHQHKRQQKWERQTDRQRQKLRPQRIERIPERKRRGGMRSSSSSAAEEGKSTSSLAGLRYKVWRAVFGAMKKVREGLYIGNITDAAAVLSAAEEEKERPSSSPAAAVTHILSLISQEIDPLDFKRPASRDPRVAAPSSSSPNKNCKLKQKTVPLLDIHSQNLLDHLEDCLDFIDSGRNNGGVVLVHCLAGVSRRQASFNHRFSTCAAAGDDDDDDDAPTTTCHLVFLLQVVCAFSSRRAEGL